MDATFTTKVKFCGCKLLLHTRGKGVHGSNKGAHRFVKCTYGISRDVCKFVMDMHTSLEWGEVGRQIPYNNYIKKRRRGKKKEKGGWPKNNHILYYHMVCYIEVGSL
jgi:hypothetical protein